MSPEEIHLMIAEGLVNVLERAGAYRYWTRINLSAQKGYILFKARSVHNEFKDILPLIMKYSPNIIVQHPESLRQKIHEIAFQQIEKNKVFFDTDIPTTPTGITLDAESLSLSPGSDVL